MKILLTTLNAKYIHSSLALYYLKSYCAGLPDEIAVKEFTINGRVEDIVRETYLVRPEMVGFACYIWNVEQTLQVCSMLKKVDPKIIIVLGGPEVSFDSQEMLRVNPFIDYVISGEGEVSFRELILYINEGKSFAHLAGLTWRKSGVPVKNADRALMPKLDEIPFPYTPALLSRLENRIVYYETSRGCPFNCRYCLSSTIHGVRYFSLERVKEDLKKLINARVKQVKFVDRTFNCHRERTKEIISFLLRQEAEKINFHFEVAADILDEEMIALFREAPPGYFQLEIGVQSTNPDSLEKVQRKMDFHRGKSIVERLRERGNVHLHLDLIAGLPGEDFISFEKSFNDVFFLKPHQLQLGFLKVLKGSGIRKQAEDYELVYQDRPPYEVLKTAVLSYDEMLKLKAVEDILERSYNSGRFRQTVAFAVNSYPQGAFAFFLGYAEQRSSACKGIVSGGQLPPEELMGYLENVFPKQKIPLLRNFLKLDLLLAGKKSFIPDWLGNPENGKNDLTLDFLQQRENITHFLPHLAGMTMRQIYKTIHIENFNYTLSVAKSGDIFISDGPSILLFDYSRLDPVLNYPLVTPVL